MRRSGSVNTISLPTLPSTVTLVNLRIPIPVRDVIPIEPEPIPEARISVLVYLRVPIPIGDVVVVEPEPAKAGVLVDLRVAVTVGDVVAVEGLAAFEDVGRRELRRSIRIQKPAVNKSKRQGTHWGGGRGDDGKDCTDGDEGSEIE